MTTKVDKYDSRNHFIDIVKGFTMILVVIGHSLQYGGDGSFQEEGFRSNYIFLFIYSFHMPLFMLISGWLSVNIPPINISFLRKQFYRLLLPIFSFTIIYELASLLSWGMYSNKGLLKCLCQDFTHPFSTWTMWFLWSVLFCRLLHSLCLFFRNKVGMVMFLIVVLLVIPDSIVNVGQKIMFIFFEIGYWINSMYYKTNGSELSIKQKLLAGGVIY